MLKRKFKSVMCGGLVASALLGALIVAPLAQASDVNARRQAMLSSMQQTISGRSPGLQELDAAARASQDCEGLRTQREANAQAYVERHTPPDPSKVIQNTTCFVDVATVQIPTMLTGIGFIDSIISSQLQKFMTGTCSKAQGFMESMKRNALDQLSQATGGSGGLQLNFTQQAAPDLQQLQQLGRYVAGSSAPSGSSASPISGSIANLNPSNLLQGLSGSTAAPSNAVASWQNTSADLMCSAGIADNTKCPTCMANPKHPNCIGQKPECGSRADLEPPFCNQPWNWFGGGS